MRNNMSATLLVSEFNFLYFRPTKMGGLGEERRVDRRVLKTSLPLGSALADNLIYMIYFNAI